MTSTSRGEPTVARRSGRPRGADSAARREEILDAAIGVFVAEGYGGTSMSSIARAAGISNTGLVHHYPTKEAVLQAVLDRRMEADLEHMQTMEREEPRGWGRLEGMYKFVELHQRQPEVVSLFVMLAAEATDLRSPAREWLVRHHERVRSYILLALDEAAQVGEVREQTPREAIARLLVGALDGLQWQWLSDDSYADMAEDVTAAVASLKAAWSTPLPS